MDKTTSFTAKDADCEKDPLLQKNGIIKPYRKRKPASICRKCIVFGSCIMQLIVCSGIAYGLSVMYAELVIVFDAKRADAAMIQSLYSGLSCATGIMFAGIIRKFGPGKCIAFGGVTSAIGLFASAFAHGIVPIILCTGVVAGVTAGICYFAAYIVTGLMFPENASFYLISLTIGNSLGQFIIPLLFEAFISQYSWTGAFILIAGVSLQCVPCGLVIHFSRDYFAEENFSSRKSSNAFCDRSLLTDALLWILLTNFFLNSTTGNIEAWFIVDHMISRGLSRESGSITVSVLGVGNCIGRVVGAAFRFRFKHFPTVNHWIYLSLINGCLHALIINLYDYSSILATCFIYGIAFGTTVAQTPAIMFEMTGLGRYPQAMALVNIIIGLGNAVGPLLGGFIKDTQGTYDVSFYLSTAVGVYICLATSVVAIFLRKRRKDQNNDAITYSVIKSI